MGEPARRTTYDEYLALEARSDTKHEYVDGVVVAMAGGTLEHARLAAEVVHLLRGSLEGRPCRIFGSDARVRVVETNRSTYPDVVVVCGEVARAPDDREAITNPVVLVEILSETTERSDRGEKFAHFRRLASLREYVLVSPDLQTVEVFRRTDAGWLFAEADRRGELRLESIDVTIAVESLFRDALTG